MPLSAKAVETAKPRPVRYELPDGAGLYLVIQPTGEMSWAFRYRFDGRPRKLTLGKSPALGLKDARILAKEAYLEVARRILTQERRNRRPRPPPRRLSASISLSALPSNTCGGMSRPCDR